MHQVELIMMLLAVIAFVSAIAEKVKIALPILLVLAGMAISMTPNIPQVRLDPDAVFFIFLPPLLYLEAFNTSWKDLRNAAEVIVLQAVGLVLVTVVAVGAAIHAVVPGMEWSTAMILGAIVSPTDAVAAAAIAKEVPLPKRVMEIIRGESLVNDATGLVAYQFAVAAALTGAFSFTQAGTKFLYVGFGGIAVGWLLGWLLSKLRTKLDNQPVEIIASLLSPFIAYLAAEHLHVSSVLSVVTAGLFLGWRGPTMQSGQTRLQATANWATITHVLNGFSFLLMGLQLKPILETVKAYPPHQLVIWTATAALAPIIIRFAWTFIVSPMYSNLRQEMMPDWKHLFVFSWAGMRGVVSLAAALALPLTMTNGEPFPFRDLIIFLTVAVIASTLILQGLTLPIIVKRFGFETDDTSTEEAERNARLYLAREAVRHLDEFARTTNVDPEDPCLRALLNRYVQRTISIVHPQAQELAKSDTWRTLETEALNAQRAVLIKMRENLNIEEPLFLSLQKELDLEEAHLNSDLTTE